MLHLMNSFKIGDIVMAQWQDDNEWYQATILENSHPGRYLVHYDGYNTSDIWLNYPPNLINKSEYDKHMNEICMNTNENENEYEYEINDEIMAYYLNGHSGHWYPGYILILAPNKVYIMYDAWHYCEWLNYCEIMAVSTYNQMNNINVEDELFISQQIQKYNDDPFNISTLLNINRNKYGSYISSKIKIAVLNKMYMDEIPAYRDQFTTPLYWLSSRLRIRNYNWQDKELKENIIINLSLLSLVIREMEKLIQEGAVLYVEYNVENTNTNDMVMIEIPGYTQLSLKHLINIYLDLKNNNIKEADIISIIRRLLHAMHENDVNEIEYHQHTCTVSYDMRKTVIYDIKNTPLYLKPKDLYWDTDGRQQPLNSLSDELIIELFWNGILYDHYNYYDAYGDDYKRLKKLYQFTYNMHFNELIKIFKQLKLIDILKDIIKIIINNLLDVTLC